MTLSKLLRKAPVLFFLILSSFLLLFSGSISSSDSYVSPFHVAAARSSSSSSSSRSPLYCAVCEMLVDEMNAGITRTSDKHTVQTRWRIDEKKRIPYARTEHRLMEILEQEIPHTLAFYGTTNHTGRMRLFRKHDAPPLIELHNTHSSETHTTNTNTNTDRDSTGTETLSATEMQTQTGRSNDNDHKLKQEDAADVDRDVQSSEGRETETETTNSSSAVVSADVRRSFSSLHFNHSSSLTASISALFDQLVDRHMEEILLLFHREETEIKSKLCIKTVHACHKHTDFNIQNTPPPTETKEEEEERNLERNTEQAEVRYTESTDSNRDSNTAAFAAGSQSHSEL